MWQTEIGFMMDLYYAFQKYMYCGKTDGTSKS
jgi:hypothetical protein